MTAEIDHSITPGMIGQIVHAHCLMFSTPTSLTSHARLVFNEIFLVLAVEHKDRAYYVNNPQAFVLSTSGVVGWIHVHRGERL